MDEAEEIRRAVELSRRQSELEEEADTELQKAISMPRHIAKQAGFSAPLTAVALQQFVAAAGSGLGNEDDAAVAKVYARNANLTLPSDTSYD